MMLRAHIHSAPHQKCGAAVDHKSCISRFPRLPCLSTSAGRHSQPQRGSLQQVSHSDDVSVYRVWAAIRGAQLLDV